MADLNFEFYYATHETKLGISFARALLGVSPIVYTC